MSVLFVIHIAITVALIAVILLQRSSQDGMSGLGGGGGASGGMGFLSGRAQANLLTRATTFLAVAFMANSLFLAYLSANSDRGVTGASLAEKIAADNANDATLEKNETNDDTPEFLKVPMAE